MNVILIEPAFPSNQREFARALHAVGARVIGVGERPADYLDDELKHWLFHYERIGNVCDESALHDVVDGIRRRVRVERLEATIEAHVLPAAHVREACGIPGTSVRTAYLCRDKPAMKEALREAGVPTAQSAGIESRDEALTFVERVGFPVVVKPRSSAGAASTTRAASLDELERALAECQVGRGGTAAIEEFVEGHEGFYDTLTVGGRVVHEFATHYYPNVLEGMRQRWISPMFVTTNRLWAEGYEEVRRLGDQVIRALGIETSPTHMEWFYGPKGLRFSEIGCRPPGVGAWDVYCAANEFDLYAEWARAITGQPSREKPSRRFACAMMALRPDRDGTVVGYEGVEEIERRYGQWIVASHFPAPGNATQPVEAGYMANAWIRMRHPDYDQLREMMMVAANTIRMTAR